MVRRHSSDNNLSQNTFGMRQENQFLSEYYGYIGIESDSRRTENIGKSGKIVNRQNIKNNSPKEISTAQRLFSYRDLPKDTQENLLRLQNTDGDFLRISSGEIERRIVYFTKQCVYFSFSWIKIKLIFAANEKPTDRKRKFR